MKLVMFDIDGTLTHSDGADERCFVDALGEVFGLTEIDTDWAGYPHCSDSGILEEIFQVRRRRLPEVDEVARFQAHFMALLASAATTQPFCVVEGAVEFLEGLKKEDGIAVSLASGAWECSGRLKLASAGLEVAHLPAAFADDAPAREAIMEASLGRAAAACARDAFEAVIYFGDGVWDARASRNLGYAFIGIAHEAARVERLYAEGAKRVFANFRDAEAMMAVLRAE